MRRAAREIRTFFEIPIFRFGSETEAAAEAAEMQRDQHAEGA
jgi:hypothetical protein